MSHFKFYLRKPLDVNQKVDVYKNLHNGLWSVRQKGIVVAHAERVTLRDVQFVVNQKGRERVLRERRKNVHAFVRGYLFPNQRRGLLVEEAEYLDHGDETLPYKAVTYNPYKYHSFVRTCNQTPIYKADYCDMDVRDRDDVLAIWRTYDNG